MKSNARKCSKCHLIKNLEEFNKNSCFLLGREYSCRQCERARKKAARLYDLESYRLREAERQRKRYKASKDKVNAVRRRNHAKRVKTDHKYYLNRRMRSLVNLTLKKKDVAKGGAKWRELVGCSVAELVSHIEKQFVSGMNWNNMGQWQIDHIVPLASFDIKSAGDAEFKRAWCLSNLRPLWADENKRKGDKRIFLI